MTAIVTSPRAISSVLVAVAIIAHLDSIVAIVAVALVAAFLAVVANEGGLPCP